MLLTYYLHFIFNYLVTNANETMVDVCNQTFVLRFFVTDQFSFHFQGNQLCIFSVINQEIGCEEHLQNDLFCVKWDVKRVSQSVQSQCKKMKTKLKLHDTFTVSFPLGQLSVQCFYSYCCCCYSCGFVMFENMDLADRAISEVCQSVQS